MKVVIVKKYGKFSNEGATVEVKEGFARNFLIPNGIALELTPVNLKHINELKKEKILVHEREKKTILELKEKIEKISLTITSEVKEDQEIYGTISEAQILKALKEEGVQLEKTSLVIESPIKKIGVYNIQVNLHPEIQAKFRVWVVKK